MDYTPLSASPLFKGIVAGDIEKLMSSIHFRIKKFAAGSVICQGGDIVESLMILLSGTVRGEMVDYAGRIITIEDIVAPGALAPAFIFGKNNRFPVNVVAVSEGELLIIDRAGFLKLLMNTDVLLVNFLDMISNRSQFLSEKIKFLNFKTIKGKLAYFILQKAGKNEVSVSIGMTQNELAEFFGVARPSVARALGELEADGTIRAKGRNIIILDRKGLADITND